MRTVTAMLVLAATFSAGAAMTALGDSHDDTTYYACLFGGSLSQAGTSPPANCGRGTLISWSAAGPQGEQGLQGAKGLQWRGEWSPSASYAVDDAVQHDGSAWISLVDNNLDNEPGTGAEWALLAQKGDKGEQGPQGDRGEQGDQGLPGPAGDPGLRWMGNWDTTTSYSERDLVHHNGSAWYSLVDNNQGNEPSDQSAAWALLSQKGDKGETGSPGAPGPAGNVELSYETESTTAFVEFGETHLPQVIAVCPINWQIIGGGGLFDPSNVPAMIRTSGPIESYASDPVAGWTQDAWEVRWLVRADDGPSPGVNVTFTTYAICANLGD